MGGRANEDLVAGCVRLEQRDPEDAGLRGAGDFIIREGPAVLRHERVGRVVETVRVVSLVVVVGVLQRRHAELAQVAETLGLAGLLSHLCEYWEEDGCENSDNGTYHEQFIYGKALL